MKKLQLLIFGILIAAGIVACSSDDTADQTQIAVQFNTIQSPLTVSSQTRIPTSRLTFDSGFITIVEMEFEAESDNNDLLSVEFNLEQNTIIDFATGVSTPDINNVLIPAGIYDEVSVSIELQDETDAPSVVLFGTYLTPTGEAVPVRFEFNSGETFEVEREGRIVFAGDEVAIAQITIDPVAWFAAVTDEEMTEASRNAEGVIVISETQNPDIFDIVADGLDLATEVEIFN